MKVLCILFGIVAIQAGGLAAPDFSRMRGNATAPPDRVWTVTTTNDSGPGSLRQAILDANDSHGQRGNLIQFHIGSGPQTITPASRLPDIVRETVVDGTTQPGFAGKPIIEMSGTIYRGPGLILNAPNCTVRGLVMNRWLYAIELLSNNGIVEGNYIGTDVTGTATLSNRRDGVVVFGFGHRIGGIHPESRNIISGNLGSGILFITGGPLPTVVQGNLIGTDVTGLRPLPNSDGISLSGGNVVVGGTEPTAANLISGNWLAGIRFYGGYSNVIQGNLIGTDATGKAALPNDTGITMFRSQGNWIGGFQTGAGNVISGNTEWGIRVWTGGYGRNPPLNQPFVPIGVPNRFYGNYVGTDRTRTNHLGNGGEGIAIWGQESFNTGPQEILGNCIFGNKGLGINLGVASPDSSLDGPQDPFASITPNDELDSDNGPNGLQNFPIITSVSAHTSGTLIVGTLKSVPDSSYFVDLYSSMKPHRTGYGEGQFYLGSAQVTTDSAGDATFSFRSTVNLSTQFITATARDELVGNTSEFSRAFEVP